VNIGGSYKIQNKNKMIKLPSAINEDEFVKLIKNTKEDKYRVIFLLGFGAGLRVSEIEKLEKRDINLKEKRIFIRQGKGKKDRVVPLPKGFKQKYLDYIPFSVGVRAMQKTFKKCADKSGILLEKPDLHFHSLRHGFGSTLANKGVPIHHIRTLMGHSNISTTNVYLELNPTEALKSYENLF
jgi:integrase/recombinase XerD